MHLNAYIAARALQSDLLAIDTHFSEVGISDMKSIILLKNALLALSNLVDFELTIREIYEEHRTLSASFTEHRKNYEFAKYLRNKFVGHIHPDLVEKAVEWRPELRYMVARMEDQEDQMIMFIVNLYLLETGINSYVDENEKHKIFESETDLVYPPDWQRFLRFLEVSIRSAIQYLTELCAALNGKLDRPDPNHIDLEMWKKAGETTFRFLKKK